MNQDIIKNMLIELFAMDYDELHGDYLPMRVSVTEEEINNFTTNIEQLLSEVKK